MENIAPKLTPEEYEDNFAELHPPFSKNSAVAEANRCLYCFDSPCMKACPTHIDISSFIKKIATGNVKGSAKTILESNWIALTCAKACPVAVLCEGACVYNARGEKPIEIGRLQRYAIDWYFENGMLPLFSPAPATGKSIGVIGAGPAGLSCAAELCLLGHGVTVYDAREIPGGLDTWGIAPYKTTQADSIKEVKLVQGLGATIRTNTKVGSDITVEELSKTHDAVFIGVGLNRPSRLNIEGEDLHGVYDALDFIAQVTTRKWSSVNVGKRVAVIGAGNTAIDAATESKRLGAEHVAIIYRRSKAEMPAFDFEFELAKSDGVQFHFLTSPVRIIGNRKVEALECVRMTLGKTDAEGRRVPVPIEGSTFQIPVDMIIKSVGQHIEESFFSHIPGLKIEHGQVKVHPETMQTSNPRFFAGGDCINGGKEVVHAAADGKRAAHAMNEWLMGGR